MARVDVPTLYVPGSILISHGFVADAVVIDPSAFRRAVPFWAAVPTGLTTTVRAYLRAKAEESKPSSVCALPPLMSSASQLKVPFWAIDLIALLAAQAAEPP